MAKTLGSMKTRVSRIRRILSQLGPDVVDAFRLYWLSGAKRLGERRPECTSSLAAEYRDGWGTKSMVDLTLSGPDEVEGQVVGRCR